MKSTVEAILLRAREERLAAVTGAELKAQTPKPRMAPVTRPPRSPRTTKAEVSAREQRRNETARKAWALYAEGLSVPAIAERLGKPGAAGERSVYRSLKRAQEGRA